MANYTSGADALNVLNQTDEEGMEFTSLKSGTTLTVKVLGTSDLIQFFSYGIYKKINSFVAENPSKKSAKGYPVDNLTPWDLAWQYHKDKSEVYTDAHGVEAGKYRAKQRFVLGFFDLDSGEPIIVDLSKNQAQAVHGSIKKYEKKLGKLAFELAKEGSGTNTTVSLTPVLDMDEDLTDEQRKNFDKAPAEFDMSLFDNLLYEADEDEQIQLLAQAGFDVRLVGLKIPSQGEGKPEGKPTDGQADDDAEPIDIQDDDLPF